jgi:hypothetical protein
MSEVTIPVISKLGVKLDQPAPARDPAGQRNRRPSRRERH